MYALSFLLRVLIGDMPDLCFEPCTFTSLILPLNINHILPSIESGQTRAMKLANKSFFPQYFETKFKWEQHSKGKFWRKIYQIRGRARLLNLLWIHGTHLATIEDGFEKGFCKCFYPLLFQSFFEGWVCKEFLHQDLLGIVYDGKTVEASGLD